MHVKIFFSTLEPKLLPKFNIQKEMEYDWTLTGTWRTRLIKSSLIYSIVSKFGRIVEEYVLKNIFKVRVEGR